MRPRRLVMEGLRSYRQRQEINFTDGLFAITGLTGSGKSSILEGLVFALYGSATFEARNARVLISDRVDELRVSLEFRVQRETYQVTRSLTASGRHSVHELKGPDGQVLAARASEVDAAIERLLGLKYEDFLRTVVLPQGAFQNLLHSTPTQRTPLLKNLLGLFQLDELAERVAQQKARLSEAVTAGRGLRQALPAHPEQEKVRLRELQESSRALQDQHQASLDLIRAERALAQTDETRIRERETQLNALVHLSWPTPSDWEQLWERKRQLEQERLEISQLQEQLQVSHLQLEQERAQLPSVSQVRAWERAHQRLSSLHEGLQVEGQRLNQERSQLLEQEEQLQDEGHEVRALEQRQREAEECWLELQQRLRAAQAHHQQLTQLRQEHLDRVGRHHDLTTRRQTLHDQLRSQEEQRQLVQSSHSQLESTYQRLLAEWEEARRHAGLAELCQGLASPDPCPVCARELPTDWSLPISSNQSDLSQQLSHSQSQWRQSELALAALDERLRLLQNQLSELHQQLAQLPPCGPDPIDLLEQSGASLLELQAQEEAAREAAAQARVEQQRRFAVWDSQRQQFQQRQQALVESEKRLCLGQREFDQQIELLSAESQCQWPLQLSERLLEWESRHHSLEQSQDEQRRRERDWMSRDQAWHRASKEGWEQPFQRRVGQLRDNAATLRAHGWLTDPPGEVERSEESWRATGQQWQHQAEQARQRVEAELVDLRELSHQRRDRQQRLLAERGFARFEDLEVALEEARASHWKATQQLELLETQIERLARLSRVLRPAEEKLQNLEALHELLGNKTGKDKRLSYTQWVLQQRQEQLLALASSHFQQISAGQYGFAKDFLVLDLHSGLERKPATLSGGESFLASLALALALSELVARRGGRLEAFFIDEGFGSLSPECLDRALTALEVLAAQGRMIGVISHVPLMAERIEQVWMVSKTPAGSRIEVLSEELRKRLLEADLRSLEAANHPLFAGV